MAETVVPGLLKPFLSLNIIFSLVYCCFFFFFLFSFKFLPSWSGMIAWLKLLFWLTDNDWQLGCRWGVCAYVAMFTDLVGELIWYRCGAQNKSDVFDCGDGVLLLFFEVWCCENKWVGISYFSFHLFFFFLTWLHSALFSFFMLCF